MGFGNYFFGEKKREQQQEKGKQQQPEASTNESAPAVIQDKQPAPTRAHAPPPAAMSNFQENFQLDLAPPSNLFPHPTNSRPQSSRMSTSGRSMRSARSSAFVDDIRHEVMCNYIYQKQSLAQWIGDPNSDLEGCMLRRSRGNYISCPQGMVASALGESINTLNLQSAITVNSRVMNCYMQWHPDAIEVPIGTGLRIQIVASVEDLCRVRKHQGAAYVASEALLLVWDDDPVNIVSRAQDIIKRVTDLTWKSTMNPEDEEEGGSGEGGEKEKVEMRVAQIDEESGEIKREVRPVHMLNTYLVSVVLAIVMLALGAAWRQLAIEITVDGQYTRLALVALGPIQIFFTLFFTQVIVGCLTQIFGPISQLQTNSKFYSATTSPRLATVNLPHVTIQCPVYKEGLAGVIIPTVRSLKDAIATYEMQGGSANIFINDDGLQLIPEEERQRRIDFYADHNIGWVARPKHGEDGFVRKGKFKKASNMNYALMISNLVEEKLSASAFHRPASWSQSDEAQAYDATLRRVLEENGRAWADGNIRVGDYILLIDSDTRVPRDCLLDAVSEMEQSPEVGIMQFSSGVMQVVHDYFENGITFFTNLIYSAIRYCVANGDVAPFVGHNAILRWSAIQQVSYVDEDGYDKFWSESHVSEDFDMSLRLQCSGYIIRLAAWAGEGFKEGVSLTVYDELARWEKYAYGCNELLFHPLRTWLWRGPFTPLFRRFLFSNIRFTSKITIISYIGTYYAIGAAWLLTSANYFVMGWFNGFLDKYYLDSWQVWFSLIIVFNGLGNVALAAMRYRNGEKGFLSSIFENFKWTLCLVIFLGGLSLHVSQALLCHMFEIDMQWGATSKEAEKSNFFLELPKLLSKFKWSIAFSLSFIVLMVIMAVAPFIPHGWHITNFVAILPMATVAVSHFLLPTALNPALMTFSF